MKRHTFVWENLAFGALFLVVAGYWIAWKQDTLNIEHLAVTAPVVLIVIGGAGIFASLWRKK